MTKVPEREQYRTKSGELDDSDFGFTRRAAAWTTYLQIAADVHPPVISSLITDVSLDMIARSREKRRLHVDSQVQAELDQFIAGWCAVWGFSEYFAHVPAQNTIVDALDARENGQPLPTTFVCDVHGNQHDGTDLKITRSITFSPATGEEREYGLGAKLPMHLPDFRWDPTRETLSHAQKRITDAIKPLVRAELQTIRDSYLADDYEPVARKRDGNRHYEWFARRRLRRESVDKIMDILDEHDDTRRDRRTVEKGIKRAEIELGITRSQSRRRRNTNAGRH